MIFFNKTRAPPFASKRADSAENHIKWNYKQQSVIIYRGTPPDSPVSPALPVSILGHLKSFILLVFPGNLSWVRRVRWAPHPIGLPRNMMTDCCFMQVFPGRNTFFEKRSPSF